MEICPFEDAPADPSARSFAPTQSLLARVTRGRSDWFLRCGPDQIAIQLGTQSGLRRAQSEKSILLLDPSEIVVVRRESELLALPDGDGSFLRAAMVYIDLHLRHSRTEDLHVALIEHDPGDPARETVRVIGPGLIRLVWEGPHHRMSPSANDAIDLLRSVAGVSPEAQPRSRDWRELSHEELGDHLLQLQDAGRYDEVMEILNRRDSKDGEGATEYVHRPSTRA